MNELTDAKMTIMDTIALGEYQLTITFTDSFVSTSNGFPEDLPAVIVRTTKLIATDECLTNGLDVPFYTGGLDDTYIIEDPEAKISFD